MRTFLNHIENKTLDEIKTSLDNLWQQMIQLSEFFQYSFVLILKRKCLVRASRVRSGESGTPSTIIYTRWSSRRYELGCDTPVVFAMWPLSARDTLPRKTKTNLTLERLATIGSLRSINPDMIHHFTSQSQTSQLFKIKILSGPARHHHAAIFTSPCAVFGV